LIFHEDTKGNDTGLLSIVNYIGICAYILQ